MKLNTLKPEPGSTKKRTRVGRGNGSKGTYSGKGMKGQTARAGGRRRPGFAGGQTPLYMRMPKLAGFKNPNRINYLSVNVGTLEKLFVTGDEVTMATLVAKKVVRNVNVPVKILGTGELTIALTVKIAKISKAAEEKITKAKGKVETV